MKSLREVKDRLLEREKRRVAVAAAEDRPVLEAIKEAMDLGIAEATLCGDEPKIRQIAEEIELDLDRVTVIHEPEPKKAAERAVRLVHDKEAHLVMKGLIGTADFLKAVLNKEYGLRTGKLLSHVAVFDSVKMDRLILMTDAAMIMYPTLEEKIGMINNTIPVCKALEIENPKAAAVCAVEVINPSMQPTIDAGSLAIMSQRGQFKGITVDGPLGLDNALDVDAAKHKGINSPVAGHADVLLMPNIECGNIMWKTLVYMARCEIAGVLMGAAAPVVITSRSDAPETKLNSIALALLIAGSQEEAGHEG